MTDDRFERILTALARGEMPVEQNIREADLDESVIETALKSVAGRRWLRTLEDLSLELADRLVGYEEDFRIPRRDRSLDLVVRRASPQVLVEQQATIAASPAASSFWERISKTPDQLVTSAAEVASGPNGAAAENVLYLLVLDPIDPFGISEDRRVAIARAGLQSPETSVRSLAAEYLYDHRPEFLTEIHMTLVHDADERIRALGWSAGMRADTLKAMQLAESILNDETARLDVRRSALAALGTNFSTPDVVDILADQVQNPELDIALDAGNLLYRLHRHPVIATAAAQSPHKDVREIGEFLLDPYRGSPAAGGSRPGDPTGSDVFAELIRQTEERALEDYPEEDDEP